MKNIIFIIILLLPQSSFAETWQCRYDFDGEMRTVVLERKGNTFQDMKTNFNFDIIWESENSTHLHGVSNDSDEAAGIIHLDKKNTKLQMIAFGLNNYLSELIHGNCIIF